MILGVESPYVCSRLLGRNVIKSKVLKYGFKPIFKPNQVFFYLEVVISVIYKPKSISVSISIVFGPSYRFKPTFKSA